MVKSCIARLKSLSWRRDICMSNIWEHRCCAVLAVFDYSCTELVCWTFKSDGKVRAFWEGIRCWVYLVVTINQPGFLSGVCFLSLPGMIGVVVAYIQHIKAWSSSFNHCWAHRVSKMSKMFLCWSCKYVHPHQSILSPPPFFLLQHESTWLNQSGAVS